MIATPNQETTGGSAPKAQAVPLPSAMPRKVWAIHTQILGALIETNSNGLRYPLARNVSDLSVNRAARRWAARR